MKKSAAILISLLFLFSFTGCGSEISQSSSGNPSVSISSNAPSESKSETALSGSEESSSVSTEPPKEDTTPAIGTGESASTDICEFTIDYVNITNDVMPPNPGRLYSHYEADSGKVYVDLCVAYKNTASGNVSADRTVSGKLIYADKYEYTGFSMIEKDSRSDFTYSNITAIAPLSTEYVHYLFTVPEEVGDSESGITLRMNIGGADYKIIVRESAESPTASTEPADMKTSGAIAPGEVVVTKNSEFNVDYSNITKDVLPPNPGSFYSHYEADAGKAYVDICFAYKNTSANNVGADTVISAKLKYADKYDYSGFSMIEEDSRGNFTYSNITDIAPLSTEYVHYLFEVPEEVSTSSESIVITFTIDGNTYTYTVR